MKNKFKFRFSLAIILGFAILVSTCLITKKDSGNSGDFLLKSIEKINEHPETGSVIYQKYTQSEITNEIKRVFDLEPGVLSIDRYEVFANMPGQLVGKNFDIIFTRGIGQVNPQDPGFGPTSITKGFYCISQADAKWISIGEHVIDSLQNSLEKLKP